MMVIFGHAAISLMGCAGSYMSGSANLYETREAPEWVESRPAIEGIIVGVGQSKNQNPGVAKNIAAQYARDEIAASVKVRVESLINDFMQTSGIGGQAGAIEFTQAVSVGVTDATLAGAMIRETFLAQDGTYFVLMDYSLDNARRAAIQSARQEVAAWNEFMAGQDFERLEEELAKLR